MKNETLTLLQIICSAALGVTLIIQTVLYFSFSTRLDTVEHHLDVLREAQINISH